MNKKSNLDDNVNELPEPDEEAQQHSANLIEVIRHECEKSGGAIPFKRYMELALYEPELGYYAAGLQKFGEAGDFITAPEISPIFSQCVAHQCKQILSNFDEPVIIEFGAGSGAMAADILNELNRLNCVPDKYIIIEVSTFLRQKQLETIERKAPELLNKIEWLDALPEKKMQAVVLANEVLDAMPVECFQTAESGLKQLFVEVEQDHVKPIYSEADLHVVESVKRIEERAENHFETGYQSEFNPVVDAWIASVSDALSKGVILLIDYGYSASEYYHPQRNMGTLVCHYQHRAHANPFWYPGLQDITSFVDFSAIAYAAVEADLQVRGYTTQAAFLMGSDLDKIYESSVTDDAINQIQLSQQIKTLTLPSEMGERFKVIALTKNYDEDLMGFSVQDYRSRL